MTNIWSIVYCSITHIPSLIAPTVLFVILILPSLQFEFIVASIFKSSICKNAKLFKSYLQPFGASVNNEILYVPD